MQDMHKLLQPQCGAERWRAGDESLCGGLSFERAREEQYALFACCVLRAAGTAGRLSGTALQLCADVVVSGCQPICVEVVCVLLAWTGAGRQSPARHRPTKF